MLDINKAYTFLKDTGKSIVAPDSITKIAFLFNYNPYLIEQPILNKILNSSEEKIIKFNFLLEDLGTLKHNYIYVVESLDYLEIFWNTNSAKYLISKGLGSSMGNNYVYSDSFFIDREFNTLLIMQKSLLAGFIKSIDQANKLSLEIIHKIEKLSVQD